MRYFKSLNNLFHPVNDSSKGPTWQCLTIIASVTNTVFLGIVLVITLLQYYKIASKQRSLEKIIYSLSLGLLRVVACGLIFYESEAHLSMVRGSLRAGSSFILLKKKKKKFYLFLPWDATFLCISSVECIRQFIWLLWYILWSQELPKGWTMLFSPDALT